MTRVSRFPFGVPAAAALAVAAGYGLLRAARAAWFPPYVDEGIYGTWTNQVFLDAHQRFVSLANGKEPLLNWAGAAVMKLGFDAITADRAVSVCAGAVTLAMTALLGRELGGRRAAYAAAALYVFVPFFLVHDAIGIMEPLLAAATTSALYLQLRLARRPTLGMSLSLGIALAVALLTKHSGLYALVLMPAALLVFPWRQFTLRRLMAWAGANALAAAVAELGYAILRLSDLYRVLGPTRDAIHTNRPFGTALAHWWQWTRADLPGFWSALHGYVTLPLIAVGVAGAVLSFRRRRGETLLLAVWVLVPIGSSVLLAYNDYPRYVLGAVPPFLPFIAVGLVWTARRVRRVVGPAAAVAAVAMLLVPALGSDARLLVDPARAAYPALDDQQYAVGSAAGNAWLALERELRRMHPAGARVAYYGDFSPVVTLGLGDRFQFIEGPSPSADAAPFVVDNGAQAKDAAVLRVRWRYERPRGGTPLVLYARGITVMGRFVTTPTELRAVVGAKDDTAFDVWLQAHRPVHDWYDRWFASRG